MPRVAAGDLALREGPGQQLGVAEFGLDERGTLPLELGFAFIYLGLSVAIHTIAKHKATVPLVHGHRAVTHVCIYR